VTGFLPLDCFDGNPCTADVCTEEGCRYVFLTDACDDDDNCTEGDQCLEGECVAGPALNCDDGNDCTSDTCNPALGCVHTLIDNPCCKGGASVCDDKNPCTVDTCHMEPEAPKLCTHELRSGQECNDGNACTADDACTPVPDCTGEPKDCIKCVGSVRDCDDDNLCTTDPPCDPKLGCKHTVIPGPCDDGNDCTQNDQCLASGICGGKQVNCDDKNACTKDSCQAGVGCVHDQITGACNDGNACTTGDTCGGGSCVGSPVDCNDGNPCTQDSCHPALGCQRTQIAGPCDDGKSCTVNDQCVNGQCIGTQQGLCCTPDWSAPVNRVSKLSMGVDGNPGNALNVDGNAATCAPSGSCSQGLDNSLSPLADMANPELVKAFAKGDLNLLFEHRGFNANGTPYNLGFWQGKPADAACNPATQSCAYKVDLAMIDANCQPKYGFTNAKVVGTKLTAGGVGYNWPLDIPISAGASIKVTVANTMIDATVTISGGKPASIKGILAGAVPKVSMIEGVNAIPDDQLPVSKETIIGLLDFLVQNDIDTDGDKVLDAASIGILFETVGGSIVGVKE
jgi:hypothetical protein